MGIVLSRADSKMTWDKRKYFADCQGSLPYMIPSIFFLFGWISQVQIQIYSSEHILNIFDLWLGYVQPGQYDKQWRHHKNVKMHSQENKCYPCEDNHGTQDNQDPWQSSFSRYSEVVMSIVFKSERIRFKPKYCQFLGKWSWEIFLIFLSYHFLICKCR